MRVFIFFEGSFEPFDISPDQTVGAMKQMVKNHFLVQLPDDKHVWHFLELSYCGGIMQDSWALCDVGITGGCAIRCLVKSERRPVMHVFNAVTGETLPVTGSEAPLQMSVARLKTVVSVQSCLPVSTFRLSTSSGVELYDCNQLQDYAIEVGSTLRLDSWDGWVEFLQGCLLGHRLTVQSHLSQEKTVMRFQLRVALYIAASLGHLDLADWLIERGVRADEPVGVHPYRQWCHQTAHRDSEKCPIHVAAEMSQLRILKLFVTKNVLTLACRDSEDRDPLKIAIQWGHRDCVRYLANKLCSVVSLPNMSLPMRIYLQMKHWGSLAQKRAANNQCWCNIASLKARVDAVLLVDGFGQSKMSSKSIKAETRPRGGVRARALQTLPPTASSQQLSLQSVSPGDVKEIQKKQKQDVKHKKNVRLDEMKVLADLLVVLLPRQSVNNRRHAEPPVHVRSRLGYSVVYGTELSYDGEHI
ncbi:protein ANKUB1 [Anabas testudineus]|uniref:protein ANKUB1 n=1 Tax=Anabas testudineus TaxID=64144 RepID=UPI000E4611CE|nr:protein ANKUB1 [Anabas testudineus]